ncbi:MAG: hypothetical protein V2J24_08620, partial [Pseudomonadales bacterium]|nr:hypothetical protein [Pseudomonadales bacterium]
QGDIEIVDSGGTIFTGPVQAGTVTLTGTAGTIEFAGDTSISTELVTSAADYALAFTGADNTIDGPAVTRFLNTGLVTIGDDAGDAAQFTQGVDTLSGPAGTAVAGRITTGRAAAQAIDLNATTLTANTTLVAGAGSVAIASVTEGGNGFGLTVQDPAATGTVSIGAFQLGALTTAGGSYDVSLLDAGSVSGDTNFLNTGIVTLGDQGAGVDVLNFDGGLDTTNNSVTDIAASVRTDDTQMDLGPVALTGDSTLRSGAGALNVESVAGAGRTLVLQDTLATGTVSVAGDLTVDSLVVSAGAYAVRLLGGATVTTPTSFLSSGTVTLGAAAGAVTTFVGGLDTTAAAGTVAAGTVATADAPMVLSPLTLTDSTTLVADAASITVASISGPGQALSLQQPGATGAVTVDGEITVGRLDTSPGAYDVSLLGGGTVAASTTFLNTGVLTLGDDVGDELTFSGGLDSTAVAGGTRIAGEVATDDALLSLGATTVLVDATLESGAGALNVASVAGSDRRLAVQSLTATGAVTFAGDVALGALDTFNGAYDVTFAGGGTIAGDTIFRNRGVVTLGDGAADFIAFDGGLDTVGAEATRLDGTVVSVDADIDFGTTVLTGAASVRAGSGTIDFGSVSDGGAGLALAVQDAAATGAVRFLGEIGLGALETFAGAYDVALLGGGDVAADTTFLNTTQIVIGDDGGDATVFGGGLDTRSAATTNLAGVLMATDAQIDLGVTTLLGPTTVIGGAGAVNIATVAGGGQGLSLQDSDSTGAVTILDRFDDLASLTSADGDFAITLRGGGEVTGATALRNRGLKVLGGDADDAFRFAGGLAAETGITRLLGSFTSVATDLSFGAMEIAGPTTLATGDGALRAGAVDGGGAALAIDAGDGAVLLGSFANGGAVTFTEAEATTVAGDFTAASLDLEGGSSFTVGGGLDIGESFFNAGTSRIRIDGPTTLGSFTSQASDGRIAFLGDATVDGELLIIDGAPADTSGDVAALTVGGALRANSVTVGAPDVAVALEGAVDVAGVTRLLTTGGVRLGTAGDLQAFRGGLSIAGPATTFASISVDSGPLEIAAVTQAGATSFASGGQTIGTGTIASRGFDLAIDAGNGDVLLGGVTGAGRLELRAADSVATGDLSAALLDIDDVSVLTTEGVFEFGAIDSADMSGSLLFRGAGAVTGEQATVFANAGGVVFEAAPVPGRNVTFREGASLDLAAGTFVFGGGLDTRAAAVTLNGSRLVTESAPITAAGLNVVGTSALDSTLGRSPETGAAITLDGLVTGDGASLDLFAGSGNVDVRQTVALGSFAVRSGETLTLNDVTTTGNSVRVVVSGDISLNGDITAQQGDVVILSTDGTLQQLVGLIDPDVDESQSNGQGAIVRALDGDAILAAKDAMTVNLVEAPQGDILLALLGPAEAGVARGIIRGQSFGAISNEGSGSADLIAGGTVAVVAAERAEFGDEDNGFLIAGDGQFITLDGGDSFIQESNASTLQTLDGGVAQDFDDAFNPLLDDPLRPFETQVDGAVFDALSAALLSRVSATARRTSNVADSEDALAQQADEEELLTNLSEDVFQDIRLVSQDQQPLCLPETLQGFDSVGCAAGAEATAVRVDAVTRPFPDRAAATAPDASEPRRVVPGSRRLGPRSIGGAGGAD